MTYKVVAIRAGKTFLQAFLAVMVASGSGYVHGSVIQGAAVAGGAAVLSALQNSLVSAETKEEQVAADKTYRSTRVPPSH